MQILSGNPTASNYNNLMTVLESGSLSGHCIVPGALINLQCHFLVFLWLKCNLQVFGVVEESGLCLKDYLTT